MEKFLECGVDPNLQISSFHSAKSYMTEASVSDASRCEALESELTESESIRSRLAVFKDKGPIKMRTGQDSRKIFCNVGFDLDILHPVFIKEGGASFRDMVEYINLDTTETLLWLVDNILSIKSDRYVVETKLEAE